MHGVDRVRVVLTGGPDQFDWELYMKCPGCDKRVAVEFRWIEGDKEYRNQPYCAPCRGTEATKARRIKNRKATIRALAIKSGRKPGVGTSP